MPDQIEHIVVLMMENRSFDHMLGSLKSINPAIDGVDPANPSYNEDLNGAKVYQHDFAKAIIHLDPKHELPNVFRQVDYLKAKDNRRFVKDYLHEYSVMGADAKDIMGYYRLGFLPALQKLAQQFTVCDRWFSSVPGPTWPNRFYIHSGSSNGYFCMPSTETPFSHWHRYSQKTIFNALADSGKTWRVYYHDIPQSCVLWRQTPQWFTRNYRKIDALLEQDIFSDPDDFPNYVFIEPRYGYGLNEGLDYYLRRLPLAGHNFLKEIDEHRQPNDDHPPHNVLAGQSLIWSIYRAIRSNESLWNSTLFIVLYDEHGGFFDHVNLAYNSMPGEKGREILKKQLPPETSPRSYTFDFKTPGVRVPAVLISPWVRSGHISHQSFDHASLLKYMTDKWNLEVLSERIRSANSISECLVQEDNPNRVPFEDIGVPEQELSLDRIQERDVRLTDLQRVLIRETELLQQALIEMNLLEEEPDDRRASKQELAAISDLTAWFVAVDRMDTIVNRLSINMEEGLNT